MTTDIFNSSYSSIFPELEQKLQEKMQSRVNNKQFAFKDIEYIKNFELRTINPNLKLSDKNLELLRLAAKRFDVGLVPVSFTSHRPVIGPIIVTFKKAVAPLIKSILGKTLEAQRDFNASVVELLVEMNSSR